MSETATRVLVIIVIVGAVILVLGTGLLAFLLFQRHSSASAPPAAPAATVAAVPSIAAGVLPEGARAIGIALGADGVAILYDRQGGGQGAVVVGHDGKLLLRLEPLAP